MLSFNPKLVRDTFDTRPEPLSGESVKPKAIGWAGVLLSIALLASWRAQGQTQVALSVTQSGPQIIVISWTNTAAGFVLEQTSQPGPNATWTSVPQAPATQNGQLSVALGLTASDQFFRLRLQNDGLPPDPQSIAPPTFNGQATLVSETTAFLYTGTNTIQSGVLPGTIEPKRGAVVRGK